jgi:tetratricopeptide (TPR) repeat protein
MDAHLVIGPSLEDYLAEHRRFRLLGATATYCRSRLGEELPQWQRRHAAHYGEVATAAGRELHGKAPRPALARLKEERENLSAALETALEDGNLALAASIGGPLWELLHRMGLWPLIRDGAQRLLECVEHAPLRQEISPLSGAPLPSSVEAVARMALAQAAHDAGQMAEARDLYRGVEQLCVAPEDRSCQARALHGLGNAFRRQNSEAAERSYQQSLELSVAIGDDPLRALNLMMLGLVASSQGRLEEAEQRLSEAVSLFRLWDDPWGLAIALNSRAQNLERLGQLLRARDQYVESLEIKRELEDRRGIAITLMALARLVPRVGEPEAARPLLLESLSLNRELGDAWGCAVTLGSLGERLLVEGQAERALELSAAARQSLDALGGGSSGEAAQLDAQIQTARARVPTDRADACQRRGRETPIMKACDAVLASDVSCED